MAVKIDPGQNIVRLDQNLSARVSVPFTRPNDATAYSALDIVGTNPATNIIFTNVMSQQGAKFSINYATLECDALIAFTTMYLHLFNDVPTAIVDNSAFTVIAGDRSKYLGFLIFGSQLNFPTAFQWTSTQYNNSFPSTITGKLKEGSTTLYAQLMTIGAPTPVANTVFTVTINTSSVI